MKTKSMILAMLMTMIVMANDSKGGGGGDAYEARVNAIRSDLLEWLEEGGDAGLKMPTGISLGEYHTKMREILVPKAVSITFVQKDSTTDDELTVSVDGKPKTCRGFFSKASKPSIVCDIQRFAQTSPTGQYLLVHHEFAGLQYLERNEGSLSDYSISQQVTEYLVPTTVLKLSLTKKDRPYDNYAVLFKDGNHMNFAEILDERPEGIKVRYTEGQRFLTVQDGSRYVTDVLQKGTYALRTTCYLYICEGAVVIQRKTPSKESRVIWVYDDGSFVIQHKKTGREVLKKFSQIRLK